MYTAQLRGNKIRIHASTIVEMDRSLQIITGFHPDIIRHICAAMEKIHAGSSDIVHGVTVTKTMV